MPDQPNQAAPDTSPAALKTRAAHVIAQALTTGDLRHPKDHQGALIMGGHDPRGYADQEVADAIRNLNTVLGEALIDAVLTQLGAQLITDTDLQALTTTAVNNPARTITLRCDHRELLQIAVKPGTDTAHIACQRLRANLTECETT